MAWLAFDRALPQAFGLDGPLDRWRSIRDEIHAQVCERGFNEEMGSFVQFYDSKELDASLLLIGSVGFLPPDDARFRGTVEAIERHLVEDGLALRYRTDRTDDGLPAGEGAFLACSFWLVDAYSLLGRRADAERLLDRLLSLTNELGLLAEEYDTRLKRQVGNFPQAFSHLALINSIHNLYRSKKPVQQRASEASRSKSW